MAPRLSSSRTRSGFGNVPPGAALHRISHDYRSNARRRGHAVFAPGFLVSATGVMCDVMMLALWVWAVIFWLKGIDSGKPLHFILSSVLIAACALTKYFGTSLILLLPACSLLRQRRMGSWICYLAIPVAALGRYQLWTKALYGRGLLWDAAQYARSPQHIDQASRLTSGLVGLSFLGGCTLPIVLFAPFLWSRRQLMLGCLAGALAGLAVGMHWLRPLIHYAEQNWIWIAAQFAFYVAGGISVLGLAIGDYRKRKGRRLVALGSLGSGHFRVRRILELDRQRALAASTHSGSCHSAGSAVG